MGVESKLINSTVAATTAPTKRTVDEGGRGKEREREDGREGGRKERCIKYIVCRRECCFFFFAHTLKKLHAI